MTSNIEFDKHSKYTNFIIIAKIFRRKDITLTRNRVIRICIQNTLVPWGYIKYKKVYYYKESWLKSIIKMNTNLKINYL